MARIPTYPQDNVLEDADKLIGTDGTVGSNLNKTKNFTIGDLSTYIVNKVPIPTLQEVTDEDNFTTNRIDILTGENTGLTVKGYKNGIEGKNDTAWNGGVGVYGESNLGIGVSGFSSSNYGVSAISTEGVGLYASSAVKPGGGSWAASSDLRVKENVSIYNRGLADILLVNPVTYDYNGKGDMPKSTGYIGVIAQEIKDIFPETVTTYKAKLNKDDEQDTDLYRFDPSSLIYALINAVKELKQEIELLKQ